MARRTKLQRLNYGSEDSSAARPRHRNYCLGRTCNRGAGGWRDSEVFAERIGGVDGVAVAATTSGDHFQQSLSARGAVEFEPGDALDHHVVPQPVSTSREKTGNDHLDFNFLAGRDIARQRRAA